MIKGRFLIKIFFLLLSIPLIFIFNNCGQTAQFTPVEAASLVLPENESLCSSMSSIQGDMRIEFTKNQSTPSVLEFGTFQDNYWLGNAESGKAFERKLEFNISHKESLTLFYLEEAAFDDWISIKVNGQMVFVGPYGGDRLELQDGRVHYGPGQYGNPELRTSWEVEPGVDLRPYLINGTNVVEMKVIVAGAGEGAIKILVQGECGGS